MKKPDLLSYKTNKKVNDLLVHSKHFFEMFFTSLAWIVIMALALS